MAKCEFNKRQVTVTVKITVDGVRFFILIEM